MFSTHSNGNDEPQWRNPWYRKPHDVTENDGLSIYMNPNTNKYFDIKVVKYTVFRTFKQKIMDQ